MSPFLRVLLLGVIILMPGGLLLLPLLAVYQAKRAKKSEGNAEGHPTPATTG
ncbi:MAG: hypothetical protein QM784_00830 [Polyangiaceae bacterium]